MHQKEKYQQQIRLGMQSSGKMQGEQSHVPPGIAGDDEYDHEDQEQPGGYAVDLDQNSARLRSSHLWLSIPFYGYQFFYQLMQTAI